MNLTFAEDFSSEVSLDSELMGTPDSGYYWNRGVHPTLTVDNLLTFLPNKNITFSAYNSESVYGIFNTSRKKSDVVVYEGVIYQSITALNEGNTPSESPSNWLVTDINSLRIKAFIWTIEDNVLSALSINRSLIENQYIYNNNNALNTITDDYFGWSFEPKGSDYVTIRINQISFQANTTTPQDLYVINQGRLLDTITLNPNNGILEFEEIGYSFSGKGKFLFVAEGQEVYSDGAYNDPLKYDGFVCTPIVGAGTTPEGSTYTQTNSSNGLNFNVSCRLDSSKYITNNKIDLGKFYQTQFEYDFIRMLVHNSNNRSNYEQRQQNDGLNQQLLATESLNMDMDTVARKYAHQKKIAIEAINKTFDKFLHKKTGITIKRRVL